MSSTLIIRPAGSDIAGVADIREWQWLEYERKSQQPVHAESSIGARPPASQNALLLIPANWLHTQQLQLPAMRRAQLRQAVPFALEEHVAGDIEQLHVAHSAPGVDGSLLATAIEPYILDALLEQLRTLGVQVTRAMPDALALGEIGDDLRVLALGQDYLVSDVSGWLLLDEQELGFLVSQAGGRQLIWYGRNRPTMDWSVPLQTHLNRDPFTLLANRALNTSYNVLQDHYAPQAGGSARRYWKIAAVLAAAVLVGALAHAVTDWWLLKREVAHYQQRVQSTFRETFPAITTVVNARVQAERALAEINPAQGNALLNLLGRSAPVLSAQTGLVLHTVNYDRSGLRLEVDAQSVAELDELTAALQRQGLPARMDSAVRSADSVRGQILISGGANG